MKVKNSYKQSNLPFVPYVYYIKHLPTGIWYIGSKYAKSAHPSTFLKTYFTSSKLIQSLLSDSEMCDVEYRILKTFDSIEDTVLYEQRLLVKTKSVSNPMSANLDNNQQANKTIQCNFKTKRISNLETKKCIVVKFDMPVPDGWYEGNINKPNRSPKWFLWWHNPITLESTMLPSIVLPPADWIWGRPKAHAPKNQFGKRIWITNGIDSKQILKTESIPVGWENGMTQSIETKDTQRLANEKTIGCFYVNDGITTKRLNKDDVIPDGWKRGNLSIKNHLSKIKKDKPNKEPILDVCPICQNIIDNTHKNIRSLTCSHSCAAKLRNRNRRKLLLTQSNPLP